MMKENETADRLNHPKSLFDLLREYHDHKKYGEIVIKIEAGKIVRYEKKEIMK